MRGLFDLDRAGVIGRKRKETGQPSSGCPVHLNLQKRWMQCQCLDPRLVRCT